MTQLDWTVWWKIELKNLTLQSSREGNICLLMASRAFVGPQLLLPPSPPQRNQGRLQIFKTGNTLGLYTNYYLSRLAKMYSPPSTRPFLPSLPVNGCFVWGSGFQSGCGRDAVAALHRSITVCEITASARVNKDPRQWGVYLMTIQGNRDDSTDYSFKMTLHFSSFVCLLFL